MHAERSKYLVCSGLLILLVLGAGCTYRTLYFERPIASEDTYVDRYLIRPRVFSYKELEQHPTVPNLKGFSVSIRIEDTEVVPSPEDWRQDTALIDSLADAFLAQVSSVFAVDSLVLHQMPGESERILLIHDGQGFSPRRDYYFTLQFGTIDIPSTTTWLRIVLHVSRTRAAESRVLDSVVWSMRKIEREAKGLKGMRDNIQGY